MSNLRAGLDFNLDLIFEAGRQEADTICEVDTPDFAHSPGRHYARVTYGLAAVFRALGRPEVTWMHMARWHSPLASARGVDEETVAYWACAMATTLANDTWEIPTEARLLFDDRVSGWRFTKAQNAVNALDDITGISRDAREAADIFAKTNGNPRRGSKAYKAMVQECLPAMVEKIRARRRQACMAEIAALESWMQTEAAYAERILRDRVAWLRAMAEDVKTLIPDHLSIEVTIARAAMLERQIDQMAGRGQRMVTAMKAKLEDGDNPLVARDP